MAPSYLCSLAMSLGGMVIWIFLEVDGLVLVIAIFSKSWASTLRLPLMICMLIMISSFLVPVRVYLFSSLAANASESGLF